MTSTSDPSDACSTWLKAAQRQSKGFRLFENGKATLSRTLYLFVLKNPSQATIIVRPARAAKDIGVCPCRSVTSPWARHCSKRRTVSTCPRSLANIREVLPVQSELWLGPGFASSQGLCSYLCTQITVKSWELSSTRHALDGAKLCIRAQGKRRHRRRGAHNEKSTSQLLVEAVLANCL